MRRRSLSLASDGAASSSSESPAAPVAKIVHVDRFGNLVTNVPFVWLADASADWRARWSCRAAGRTLPLVRTYGEAKAGSAIALSNAYDRLELAISGGNAETELGLGRGARVRFVPVVARAVASQKIKPKTKPAAAGKQPKKKQR